MNIKDLDLSNCEKLTGVGVVGQTCRLGVASGQHQNVPRPFLNVWLIVGWNPALV